MAQPPENELVSVLMCVHNGIDHLAEAVESILTQSLTCLEFIIIDDGSTDGSTEWLKKRAAEDERLKIICQERAGLTRSLNLGLREVRGEYIARMDADDVAHSRRLEKQLAFLKANAEVICCGTNCRYMDEHGKLLFVRRMPQTHEDIEESHLSGRGGFILHPSAMMRTQALIDVGGYDEAFSCAQDYDLWFRLAKVGRLANLPDVLMDYRLTGSAITQARRQEQDQCRLRIIERELKSRGLGLAKALQPKYEIRPADPWWVLVHSSECGFWRTSWIYCLRVLIINSKTVLRCLLRMSAALSVAVAATVSGMLNRKHY